MQWPGWLAPFIPSAEQLLISAPIALIIVFLAGRLAAFLRISKNWKVAYTRKTFHFIIFSSASLLQAWLGLGAVVVFGSLTSLAVLWAVYQGERSGLYLALARPKDAPQEELFILVPLVTTALGGVLSNLFFGSFAIIGYLVGGWGDAVGEPVGARFGKHPYRVPSLAGVKAERSLEGSLAVFLVGSLVAIPGLSLLGVNDQLIWYALACGAAGALVEAVSTHGLDNLTIQLAASATAWALLSLM